jgi:hypothetical protein
MASLSIYAVIISKAPGPKTRCMAGAEWSTMKVLCLREFGSRENGQIRKGISTMQMA